MTSYFSDWWHKRRRVNPSDLSRESVDHVDRFDRQDRDRINKEMKEYRDNRDELAEIIDTGPSLFDDSLWSFLKADPELREKGEMRPSHLVNHAIMNELMGLPEWDRLHDWTQGDLIAAAMASVTIEPELETLADRMKKAAEEAARIQKEMEEFWQTQEGKRDLDEMIEQWKDDPDFDENQMRDIQDQIQAQIDAMQEKLEQQVDKLDENATDIARMNAAGMRSALDKAAKEQEQTNQAATGWGLDKGELRRMDSAQRLALAQRLNTPKFKRMAEIWGPLQRIANNEQQRKVYHTKEEVYDVGTGNDLSRILPVEFSALRHPVRKLDFYRKFVERKLLQYEMQGTEKVGKGGIIMCIDSSGSMSGDPDIWAKAIGLCALNIAKEQKRSFHGIIFGSSSECMVFNFSNPRAATLPQVLDFAEFFYGGGTDFVRPLNEALAILKAEFEAEGCVKGDIVFVTDGLCGVPEDWQQAFLEEKDRLGFKLHALVINVSADNEPIKSLSDTRVTIKDLLSGDNVRGLFRDL